MRKIGKSDYSKIKEEYLNGASTTDLARNYRVSHTAIRKLLRKLKVRVRSPLEGFYLYMSKAKPKISTPKAEWKLAYLAGLIDGEGTIYLRKEQGKLRTGIRIYNSNPEIISWIHENFNGEICPTETPSGKPFYIWAIWSVQDCYALLKAVSPFLVAKREKAIRVLKFCRRKIRIWKKSKNKLQTETLTQKEVVLDKEE